MNVEQPSVAARVLALIETSPVPLKTSDIYREVEEASNITHVSVTCNDLLEAGKVSRFQKDGRWHYVPVQRDLLGATVETESAEELARTLDAPPITPQATATPRKKSGQPTERGIDRTLKLRTIDRLIPLLSDDIGAVLLAVRQDVEHAA